MADKRGITITARDRTEGAATGRNVPSRDLWTEFDRLLDAFLSGTPPWPSDNGGDGAGERQHGALAGWGASIAALHVVDKENEVLIQAELPGMDESDIEILQSDGSLTICGEKSEEREDGTENSPTIFRNGTIARSSDPSAFRTVSIATGLMPAFVAAF